jgi:hypothetical protein
MSKITALLVALFFFASASLSAQSGKVIVDQSADGWKIMVDGKPMIVNGMNWDYFPIGTNFSYSLWNQSDDFIKQALDDEMSLLKNMNVNAVRIYTGIPKKWITYIYEEYGIYTMLNHAFGRYGVTVNGSWMANTEYADPRVQKLLLSEVKQLVQDYKNTPGLLLYLLGNENNYGLFWEGAETEDIPVEQDARSIARANAMYKLFNEAVLEMKAIDRSYPVAICNGDLLYLDLIAKNAPDVDILGINVYRGISFTDLYDRVKNEYGKPVLLTEFGADAFNARTLQEDQTAQAYYDKGNWKEIYLNAAGMGKANNSLGGFTFQFSDGWWKFGQTRNLDVHDVNASWSNGGYPHDLGDGENNMNEEWFGIAAKGPTNTQGFYELFPRAAYYALREAHKFNPYAPNSNPQTLEAHFNSISIDDAALRARADKAALTGSSGSAIKLSRFTANMNTYNTGAELTTTPENLDPTSNVFPNQQGFDHLQSFFVGVEAQPAPNMRAEVNFNILGNVPTNPIDEIFYENRGRLVEVVGPTENVVLPDVNRLAVYNATYTWNQEYFDLEGFYRVGRYHWGDEGDFFNLLPETNYGPNIDLYNGVAPYGMEFAGKKQFSGFKLLFGPQLWWGANPAFMLKYQKKMGKTEFTGMWHEDLQQQGATESSFAIPMPKTRRVALSAEREFGALKVQAGGLWAGQPLNGRTFQLARKINGVDQVFVDEIGPQDNWGGKMKLTYMGSKLQWYASGSVMGLVANGGFDQTLTFTGWTLKDSGSGNMYNFLSGFTYRFGNLQVAPNFMWQQPIEGHIPSGLAGGARPRNILDDPFVVREGNREQVAGELLLTFDPTPGTYMYDWDSDRREDARFAASLGFVYRYLPTSMDANIGILPDGRTFFPFAGAVPANDLWEVNARIVSKLSPEFGFIAGVYAGDAQARGIDPRVITRFGADLRMIYKHIKVNTFARINDWGPFDYHRDFNLTFPLQLMADFSTTLSKPDWFDLPTTKIGFRGTWRSLDEFSNRFANVTVDPATGNRTRIPGTEGLGLGSEWEFRTYVQIDIRN